MECAHAVDTCPLQLQELCHSIGHLWHCRCDVNHVQDIGGVETASKEDYTSSEVLTTYRKVSSRPCCLKEAHSSMPMKKVVANTCQLNKWPLVYSHPRSPAGSWPEYRWATWQVVPIQPLQRPLPGVTLVIQGKRGTLLCVLTFILF